MEQKIICPTCEKSSWRTVINNHVYQCRECAFIKKEKIWAESESRDWKRELGSKEEQGIVTPPAPRYKKTTDGQLRCQCLYRDNQLYELCKNHQFALALAEKIEREEIEVPLEKKKPVGTPWVEETKTTESVSVGISTPNEKSHSES